MCGWGQGGVAGRTPGLWDATQKSLGVRRNGYGFWRLWGSYGGLTCRWWDSIERFWGGILGVGCEGTAGLGARSWCAIGLDSRVSSLFCLG